MVTPRSPGCVGYRSAALPADAAAETSGHGRGESGCGRSQGSADGLVQEKALPEGAAPPPEISGLFRIFGGPLSLSISGRLIFPALPPQPSKRLGGRREAQTITNQDEILHTW